MGERHAEGGGHSFVTIQYGHLAYANQTCSLCLYVGEDSRCGRLF